MPLFKKKKHAEKNVAKKAANSSRITVFGADKKQHISPSSTSSFPTSHEVESSSPSPTTSSQDLIGKLVYKPTSDTGMVRRDSGMKVAKTKAIYENLAQRGSTTSPGTQSPRRVESPEKTRRRDNRGDSLASVNSVSIAVTSPTLDSWTPSFKHFSRPGSDFMGSPSTSNRRISILSGSYDSSGTTEIGKEKEFEGVELPLPPLQTTAVRLREVDARRNTQGGGFGFILRKSFLPMPEEPDKTKLVHLIEPRSDYRGPLMTGDRIIEVNGEMVEDDPHETVVEMIKASGDCVNMRVASMPELVELNNRGALDHAFERNSGFRKSGKAIQGTGTLRKQGKMQNKFKAKTEAEVLLEREGLAQDRVWVVHKGGFCLGTVVHDTPKRSSALSTHTSFFKLQGKEIIKVKLHQTGEIIEVEDDDVEKANPISLDKVEDLVNLVHLNESSVLHVLRQRYGSSLIHTLAGRHLLILNPMKPLSSYSDRVIDMFRGCRREDMPPHIFAMGQQAYRDMMVTRLDQSLILMGLSGSGKTFNTRYLLRYLTTIGQPEHGPVTNAKLDAVELLLHSFSSAATFLNPQATRCACLYSLNFDPSGTLVGTSIQTYLLERNRICQRPLEEGNFNIFHQLLLGAEDELSSELLLDAPIETEDPNLYCEELDDPQREESASYVWDLIQNCLEILGISEEEAMGLWCLLAAIYHLGFAGVRKGSVRGADYFLNPAAAQRAAILLGVDHETLGQDIFSPPRGGTLRMSNNLSFSASSPTQSDTTSITSSLFLTNMGSNRSWFLDSFVMGLYDQAFNALVMLINRSLQPQLGSKGRSVIHVLDTPGFQHRELAGACNGASFDDLCMNYVQERLQMLFHDVSFTSEQDRYLQEEINWMFSEVAVSPLSVIDTIDRHVPQRRGGSVDLHNDRRGLLWILDEESVFPGASDSSFLDRVHIYHGSGGIERSEAPLVKVVKEDNQFILFHCQRTLPVLYDANEWVRRAREHPSFRVVVNILAASKRPSIVSIFQGRGVAASATTLGTSQLKADTHRSLTRSGSTQTGVMSFTSPSSGIKKSSLCLQTKFKIDFLVDMLRKTRQWFIRCILPQLPHKLPGALQSPDSTLAAEQEQGPVNFVDIDIPLVRDQLKRAEMIKATRIYKQGFPEHITFDEFRRRYSTLLPSELSIDGPSLDRKESVEMVLFGQGVDKNTFRIGLSQAFFRAGTLTPLDRAVEERLHGTMVLFQARCKGWVGRQCYKQLQVQDSAALVIQQNVLSYLEVRDWSWWKLYLKVKPMLAIWRAEEDIKDRDSKIEKLKSKVESLESERDGLKESEADLEGKVTQLSAQLENIQSSANEASEMIEGEQLEKREMEEKLAETMSREAELTQVNEQLHLQIAEMSILARIKQTEGEGDSDSIVEKYYEVRRELETLRQRMNSEYDDQIESLESSKRSLEKKLADSESERDDIFKTLSNVRKKATKLGSEMNDLKLLLEAQQARNAELEKRQRKFDVDLNAAKDDSNSEVQAKVRLAREKELLQTELSDLKERFKTLEEENKQLSQENEDLKSELVSTTTNTSESELISLKRMKRDMETKIVDLEDELDEASLKLDNLQQVKARLELSNQTLKQQHGKELEGREEELEQVKVTLNKKLKSMTQQLDEVHEEKQSAVKVRRDLERELLEYQGKMGDPENEKKLKKQLRKYKALLEDSQEQLENEREKRSNAGVVKSLKNQLEELQSSEAMAVKNYKWLQGDMDELQGRNDDLVRNKNEMESKVTEATRCKAELESRVEDDQFEIDELLEKQRTHISQAGSLQSQLTESNFQMEELLETKASLETKVESLQGKISELEEGLNKHQFEASGHKVKELEQKLELERSSARRHESQITRLRHQLERLQDEKTEDVSHKSSDALNRSQKQIRELRTELQEAERKEQEMAKKRRNAEAKVDELEVQLQTAQADLKSAKKRIEQLHGALKDHEEYSGDEDDMQMSRSIDDSLDNLSSEGSIYSIEDDESLDLSGDEDDIVLPKSSSRGLGKTKLHSKELSPALSGSKRRKSVKDEDDNAAAMKAREKRLKQLDEEEAAFEAARKARQERLKELDREEMKPSRKPMTEDLDINKTSSFKRGKQLYDDEDDDDDADLEDFLLKQRERMKRLQDSDDEDEDVSTIKATRGASSGVSNEALSSVRGEDEQLHVTNGKPNGIGSSSKSLSREPSEFLAVSESVEDGTSRQRRKRQRRRTIEQQQLVSPEHVAKTNGVDL